MDNAGIIRQMPVAIEAEQALLGSIIAGILWSWERPLGTPLGLVKWKGASSRGEAGTSGFLSISDSNRSPLHSWER